MTDPEEYARLMARVHDAVLSGGPAPAQPRAVVSDSWRRSLAGGVDPDGHVPPLVYAADELRERRAAHPLAEVLPVLRSTLVSIADEAMHLMIVTDADGGILWREGQADVCRLADSVGLAEGTSWSEDAMGTNAMGTTLAVDRPVQIHSAEHLVRTIHAWTCAAAPVHDPDTGAVLGAIDVTGPLRTRHPATLALVTAAAQLAEGQLRVRMTARDEQLRRRNLPHLLGLRGAALLSPTGRVIAMESCDRLPERLTTRPGALSLPDGREGVLEELEEGYLFRLSGGTRVAPRKPALRLRFLGATHPVVTVDGREQPLSPRHAEILTALALNPAGMTAEQLTLALHGETGNPVTARAEVHRLRTALGNDVIKTRPYRLAAEVHADFLDLPNLLRTDLRTAAAAGPLLPRSDAPLIRDHRNELEAALRQTLLTAGDAEDLWTYAHNPAAAEDLEVWETLLDTLPRYDPRRPQATAHRNRLRTP
ncbi:helix-turn-helix domain-containing protein [Actinokineospora bangkokensis]|uniref:Transcriptional regulator n=1 Tax=Actinokineospora bangkokensis TaxID=1193682 RepID=A0A1Q9LD71_9PSEU|nr:helix-turn-helix domain-containing protein [Actinokineospora bangkokensis]OLR89959.1 transcriptional regulator [Actinokineospora bangkokensis]